MSILLALSIPISKVLKGLLARSEGQCQFLRAQKISENSFYSFPVGWTGFRAEIGQEWTLRMQCQVGYPLQGA